MTLWTIAHQAPLSVEFSRQEYWSGLPCPPTRDLPNPGCSPSAIQLQCPEDWNIQIDETKVSCSSLDPEVTSASLEATWFWMGGRWFPQGESEYCSPKWWWVTVIGYTTSLPPDFHSHGQKLVGPFKPRYIHSMAGWLCSFIRKAVASGQSQSEHGEMTQILLDLPISFRLWILYL